MASNHTKLQSNQSNEEKLESQRFWGVIKKKKSVNFLLSKKNTQPKEKYQDKIQKCVWFKLEF